MDLPVTTTTLMLPDIKSHIFVTYIGGAGGDMFTASCNNLVLDNKKFAQGLYNHCTIGDKPFSIKDHDRDVANGIKTLDSVIENIPYTYISTHLFNELPTFKISIIIRDPNVLHQIVCRQLRVQTLRLFVNSGYFFDIVKSLCCQKKYNKAARLWFNHAKKYAEDSMNLRISGGGRQLDFSNLFESNFIDSLKKQDWNVCLDVLECNHNFWLKKQPIFNIDDTIQCLEQKIKLLNWDNDTIIKLDQKYR
jgi:hypothetical protein